MNAEGDPLGLQQVPKDPALLIPDRYLDFLTARRTLIAQRLNTYLHGN